MYRRLAVTLLLIASSSVARGQHAILVVRHAEKAAESNEPGVPLSDAGRARAARLAKLLESAGVTGIYATETVRARSTAEPLARKLGLPVQTYSPRDASGKPAPHAFLERLKKEAPVGTILVVGHSNTLPELLGALGHPERIEISSHQYDDLFVVVPRPSGPPAVVRLKY